MIDLPAATELVVWSAPDVPTSVALPERVVVVYAKAFAKLGLPRDFMNKSLAAQLLWTLLGVDCAGALTIVRAGGVSRLCLGMFPEEVANS